MQLGEWLVREGLITGAQLDEALAQQQNGASSDRLGELLLQRGWIEGIDLVRGLGEQYDCDVLESLAEDMIDPGLVRDIPLEYARTRGVLPIRYRGAVGLLTHDPVSMIETSDLALLLGEEPIPVLATRQTIQHGIERCYSESQDASSDLIAGMGNDAELQAAPREGDLLRSSDQAPVSRFVNVMILEALKEGASDIHIEPWNRSISVRFRIDGVLYPHSSPPKDVEPALISRVKIMARMDIAEKRLPQDGMAKVSVGENEIDLRVSTVPVAEGERVVLRLLRHDTTHMSLTELGMRDELLASFRDILREPNGVIWVTGPTGSGKTTTLYAALQEMDTARRNILTIEDPIEYQLGEIGQINVRPKIGLTFAQGLRHILRQDPDVILVGETRDLETAEIVVQASLTGHLVFSTLHTNNALGALTRLVDIGLEPFLVAESTRALMAQRLVRRLCTACRKPATHHGEDVFEAVGCASCRDGYAGRIGLFELIRMTPELTEAAREGRSISGLRQIVENTGGDSLYADGLARVREGLTSVAEIEAVLGRPGS